MKKIVLMLALAASVIMSQSQAMARVHVDEDSSWGQILRTASLKVVEPKEVIENHHVSVFNVCVDEAEQMVRANVKVCIERRGSGDGSHCVRMGQRTVSKPLMYVEHFCALTDHEGSCLRHGTYQAEVRRSHLIPVYHQTSNGEPESHIGTLAFKKRYDLPTCN